jgi:hypothetical protein
MRTAAKRGGVLNIGEIMNENIESETIKAAKKLYRNNPNAKKLFDWTAGLKNDASETTIDRVMVAIAVDRASAILLARELERAGIGRFVTGRRGAQSRFVWKLSRVALGQAAMGATEEGNAEPATSATATLGSPSTEAATNASPLTIAAAKSMLAKSFGVMPEQIEIIVKA